MFRNKILQFSFKNNCGHIASALSMIDYLEVLFLNNIIGQEDIIILGKPFGSQSYYIIWKELGWISEIETLSMGVKQDEVPFVYFSEETMGNALGVAAGVSIATNKKIWVNLSDACLQMGNTLEAIQFIGQHKLSNIFVTIDYNDSQVTGKVNDILSVSPIIEMFKGYDWKTHEVDGHNKKLLIQSFNNTDRDKPNVFICKTVKGKGIKSIEGDIKKWHYKKIETSNELQSLVEELQDI